MRNRIVFALLFILITGHRLEAETKPYWVFFTDRGAVNIERAVAAKKASPSEPKNMSRRARIFGSEMLFDERDLEVNPDYIARVAERSGGVRVVTRYLNGVSVELAENDVQGVRTLPFVRDVRPVAVYKKPLKPDMMGVMRPAERERAVGFSYGGSFEQVNMVGVTQLHQSGYRGEGIVIAVLDSGFDRLQHAAFDSTRIANVWDFVDADDDLSGDDHGTEVLSILAALDSGNMIGMAPDATYLLARTENVVGNVEQRIEEDYWVAGIEWADSLGADIVSSSLGYTEFDDGSSYTYADLDGDTAVTTIAADTAAAKGIIVVTSAGNEGDNEWYYVTTPADGDSVFAVGSVDLDRVVSSFSSRGPTYDGRIKPDFVALGEQVLVVDTVRLDSYKYVQGTSYSAPAVSGTAALLLEANPTWDYETLRDALITSAYAAGPDSLYGYGIIDAFAASGLEPPSPAITKFRVYDPYPQPITFSATTRRIYFPMDVPKEEKTVTIQIFNFSGDNVQTLSGLLTGSGSLRNPGEAPSWDGTNFSGEDVAPGIYYYSIRLFGYGRHTGKIMVMR